MSKPIEQPKDMDDLMSRFKINVPEHGNPDAATQPKVILDAEAEAEEAAAALALENEGKSKEEIAAA